MNAVQRQETLRLANGRQGHLRPESVSHSVRWSLTSFQQQTRPCAKGTASHTRNRLHPSPQSRDIRHRRTGKPPGKKRPATLSNLRMPKLCALTSASGGNRLESSPKHTRLAKVSQFSANRGADRTQPERSYLTAPQHPRKTTPRIAPSPHTKVTETTAYRGKINGGFIPPQLNTFLSSYKLTEQNGSWAQLSTSPTPSPASTLKIEAGRAGMWRGSLPAPGRGSVRRAGPTWAPACSPLQYSSVSGEEYEEDGEVEVRHLSTLSCPRITPPAMCPYRSEGRSSGVRSG